MTLFSARETEHIPVRTVGLLLQLLVMSYDIWVITMMTKSGI